MMKTIIKERRDVVYDRCTDNKLALFADTSFINLVCKQMFGENGLKSCIEKKNFCSLCCRHHIGVKVLDKFSACFTKCSQLVG